MLELENYLSKSYQSAASDTPPRNEGQKVSLEERFGEQPGVHNDSALATQSSAASGISTVNFPDAKARQGLSERSVQFPRETEQLVSQNDTVRTPQMRSELRFGNSAGRDIIHVQSQDCQLKRGGRRSNELSDEYPEPLESAAAVGEAIRQHLFDVSAEVGSLSDILELIPSLQSATDELVDHYEKIEALNPIHVDDLGRFALALVLADRLADQAHHEVSTARRHGASWAAIAQAAGIPRSSAHQRWNSPKRVRGTPQRRRD